MHDDLIAALERAAKLNDQCVANIGQKSSIIGNCYKRDAALIRQHIADLRAGNLVRREDVVAQERAKVVNYIADQAALWLRDGHCGTAAVVQNIADAIEAGAHEGGGGE